VLLLTGDLGAGKTQFSRGAGRALGVKEQVISPTFNILLVHEGAELTLNHWDLYRLDDPDDLIDIDYFANVESEAVSLVEWGDKFEDAYLDADVEVRFKRVSENERLIEMVPHSVRGEELLENVDAAYRAEYAPCSNSPRRTDQMPSESTCAAAELYVDTYSDTLSASDESVIADE
jgi:tRNA threonylcarbamoyladenosine biosynthesis protein TsaE